MAGKKYRTSITIIPAVLIALFLGHMTLPAQESQEKIMPGMQLLLFSRPNIAFVTSLASYSGNLGGLEGADEQCQSLATAAGLPQNTYKAWLSTSSVNAIDRLGSGRGWVRVDGKPFADTREDIAAGKIFHPLRVDENGDYDNHSWGTSVWTGTGGSGTVHPSSGTCSDWTSSDSGVSGGVGNDDAVGAAFSASAGPACSDDIYRLYCFGVDKNVPVAVRPVAGRIAFLTKASWSPSTLAAADQLCMDEAVAAGLSGNFKALLAANGASAASRFDAGGPPWVRPDGVAIAPTAAALFSADFLNTAINQSADGLQYSGNTGVWSGADYPDSPGTLTTTCQNWTSAGSMDSAPYGYAGYTYRRSFFGRLSATCDVAYLRLYCLQE